MLLGSSKDVPISVSATASGQLEWAHWAGILFQSGQRR